MGFPRIPYAEATKPANNKNRKSAMRKRQPDVFFMPMVLTLYVYREPCDVSSADFDGEQLIT